jgi:hypothetical protein
MQAVQDKTIIREGGPIVAKAKPFGLFGNTEIHASLLSLSPPSEIYPASRWTAVSAGV